MSSSDSTSKSSQSTSSETVNTRQEGDQEVAERGTAISAAAKSQDVDISNSGIPAEQMRMTLEAMAGKQIDTIDAIAEAGTGLVETTEAAQQTSQEALAQIARAQKNAQTVPAIKDLIVPGTVLIGLFLLVRALLGFAK